MEAMQCRIPPNNNDAEKSVLGAMLQDKEAVMLGQELLREDDFYYPANKEIFSCMMALTTQGQAIDLITVDEELARRGRLDGVGGISYIIELSNFVPSTANVKAYINIVEEKSTLRKLINASNDISQNSYTGDLLVPEILNAAEKAIFDITMKKGGNAFEAVRPVLIKAYGQIEELVKNKGQVSGVPTGYYDLDNLLTGLHAGEMVLVAGRPSMGKTSFAMNIIEHAAIHKGKIVAVFSLEMPAEQLVMRMLCSEACVDMQKVRHGTLAEEDWMRLAEAMGPISQSKIHIDATSGINVIEMRSRCRRLQIEHGLDIVMVDYLQLMSGSGGNRSRQEEVSEISRALKGLAQELRVPVMALSQLSRAPQARADHRPVLSDLRDSGAIEQDADVVMFIHREDYYDKETEEKNIAEIIIAKQRNGPLGTVKLGWLGEYTKFVNIKT